MPPFEAVAETEKLAVQSDESLGCVLINGGTLEVLKIPKSDSSLSVKVVHSEVVKLGLGPEISVFLRYT